VNDVDEARTEMDAAAIGLRLAAQSLLLDSGLTAVDAAQEHALAWLKRAVETHASSSRAYYTVRDAKATP